MSEFIIDEEHPLSLELNSLRTAVERYQHEAHSASVKLQRHSLDTSHAIEHSHALQQENTRLREEVETLRANPDVTPHPSALQVPELTLAMRSLSDKLDFMEQLHGQRGTELAHARSDLSKTQHEIDAVRAIAARANARAQAGEHRERELERKARACEEERRLSDLVVQEYANLVRNLEGRRKSASIQGRQDNSGGPQKSLAESLTEGRSGLQRLLGEFNGEAEELATELSRMRSENELLRSELDVERKRSEADRESLAQIISELDKHRADDNTAAKMVSRYMKFSQSTSNSLQQAMEALRTRHAATMTTMNTQIEHLHKALLSERRQSEKLRDTLDELSEDIAREAYGRRREISLRLAFLGREEGLAESLRRWIRKFREGLDRMLGQTDKVDSGQMREILEKVLGDAEALLETLNGQPLPNAGQSNGSIARILSAQAAVASLTRELHEETHRRLRAQRMLAQVEVAVEGVSDEQHELPPDQSPSLGKVDTVKANAVADAVAVTPARLYVDHDVALSETDKPFHRAVLPEVDNTIQIDENQGMITSETQVSLPSHTPHDLQSINDDTLPLQEDDLQTSGLSDSHGPGPGPEPSSSHNPSSSTSVQSSGPETLSLSLEKSSDHPVLLSEEIAPTIQLVDELSEEVPKSENTQETTLADAYGNDSPLTTVTSTTNPGILHQPIPRLPMEMSSIQGLPELTINAEADPIVGSQHGKEDLANGSAHSLQPSPMVSAGTPPGMLFSTTSIPSSRPATISPKPPPHPILADLHASKHRYDDLQKAFRDCNLAIKELRKSINDLPSNIETSAVMRTAIERLNDFNEDTRVELEIRVADEERMITGYETLLSVPGALSEEIDEEDALQEIRAFIDGADKSVAKAWQQFNRKLDDLEHDIACIKRTVHEVSSGEASPVGPVTPTRSSQGWSSWTGLLGGSTSRPVSPAPTFGSVMTTPRQRQSSFGALMQRPSLSNLHERANSPPEKENPFAALGLRLPMPAVAPPTVAKGLFLSPGGPQRAPKPRASSASMYLLGLGARSTSYGFPPSLPKSPPSKLAQSAENSDTDSEKQGPDSDVE